ncbi:MAG: hypothetical protein IPN26_04640 [Bacteroidetes bacterium]|nr:hypothetical protein [Bacteroidota bacterium]
MVAKGHEVIETIVSKYLLNFLDHYYPKQSASIKTFLPKEEDFTRVFYFGNWMTDMSQFFVRDGFNKIRGNIDNLVSDYNKYIQTFKVKLSIIIKDEIIETFKNKIIEALPSYSGGPTIILPEPAKSIAQFITPLIVQNQDKIKLEIEKLCESIKNGTDEELNKIFTNLTVDEAKFGRFFKKYLGENPKEFKYVDYNDPMWHLANVFVKIMGFKKFCLADNPISFTQFEELYDIVLDSTSGSLFNLMQYYPSDHLDRPYTINPGQVTSSKPQRDFIDKSFKKSDSEGMYDYMKDYRTILSGKFSSIQQDFIMPYFINNKILNRRTVLSLLSKLGIGLHMLEDFYAHSNFYELSLRFMQGKKLNEQKYYSYNEYFKLDERNIYKEFARIHNTTNLPTEDLKNTIIEDKLYTGFYTFEDTLVSIFHLITDGIVRKIETIDIGPYIEKRLDLESDKSDKLIENEPEGEFSIDVLEALAGLASGINSVTSFEQIEFLKDKGIDTESFNEKAFDFFMKGYLSRAKIKISTEDKSKVIYVVNLIFSTINIIRKGKKLKDELQDLLEFYEFFKLLLTILTLEIQVIRIFKIIAFKLAKAIFRIIPGIIRKPFYELLNDWLKKSILYVEMAENQVNSLLKSYPGSHSYVAKDEALHKRLTHFQVTKMAGFADMFVLDNLFLNNTSQTVCSMNDTIKYVFHNPNDGMNRLSAMPDERNHTSIVEFYSINVLQNTPMNKVYQDFMKGLNKNRNGLFLTQI